MPIAVAPPRRYSPITCVDCGDSYRPNTGNIKRCPTCRLKSRGSTGCGIRPRDCTLCGATYQPTMSRQLACEACRKNYRRLKNVADLRARRLAKGATVKGSIIKCADCGLEFAYTSGPAIRCRPCQARASRVAATEASKRSPLRGEYRKRAKTKIAFGGNKEAVLGRDGHACRKCGTTDRLHVHHIDGMGKGHPRAAQNHAMDNLITLCGTCRARVHALTERLFFLRHPETAQDGLRMFLEGEATQLEPPRRS